MTMKALLLFNLLISLLLTSCAGLHQASFDHAFANAMIKNQQSAIFRNCNAANANYPLNGNPPIYYAASYGNEDAIDLLYNYGASLQARGRNGKSLAWAAAANGRTSTAQKLVALGAGSSSDLASGAAAYRQKKAADAAAAKLMADGLKWLVAAMAGGGGGGGGEDRCVSCGASGPTSSGRCRSCYYAAQGYR